jgi:hypothetical protein
MKFFVAMRVPRDDPAAEHLAAAVAEMLTATGNLSLIAYQEIARRGLSPEQFMPYVKEEISTSNIVLVVYSPNLRGGLIELGIAYALGVPVWLAAHRCEHVSSSALACASKVIYFESAQDLVVSLRIAINGGTSI